MKTLRAPFKTLILATTAMSVGIVPSIAAVGQSPMLQGRAAIALDHIDFWAEPAHDAPHMLRIGECGDEEEPYNDPEPERERTFETTTEPTTGPTLDPNPRSQAERRAVIDFEDGIRQPVAHAGVHLADCHDDFGPDQTLTDENTKRIILFINDGEDICEEVPRPYRIDCILERYQKLERMMPRNGEYRAARDAIRTATRKLSNIVARTADRDAPKARVERKPSTPRARKFSRRLQAIKPAQIAQAEAAAVTVLEELETRLLRSAENSERRQVQYAKIAEAVASNKVLLRS